MRSLPTSSRSSWTRCSAGSPLAMPTGTSTGSATPSRWSRPPAVSGPRATRSAGFSMRAAWWGPTTTLGPPTCSPHGQSGAPQRGRIRGHRLRSPPRCRTRGSTPARSMAGCAGPAWGWQRRGTSEVATGGPGCTPELEAGMSSRLKKVVRSHALLDVLHRVQVLRGVGLERAHLTLKRLELLLELRGCRGPGRAAEQAAELVLDLLRWRLDPEAALHPLEDRQFLAALHVRHEGADVSEGLHHAAGLGLPAAGVEGVQLRRESRDRGRSPGGLVADVADGLAVSLDARCRRAEVVQFAAELANRAGSRLGRGGYLIEAVGQVLRGLRRIIEGTGPGYLNMYFCLYVPALAS